MKVSTSWLKKYTSVDYEPSDLAARLTMAGLEVESFENRYNYLDKVVVGRVEKAEKHPEADRLSCCLVNVGAEEPLAIVCGAPNVREGLIVPCATIGAVLPGDFKIKKSKLRGQVSQGMLCSAAELKLDGDRAGIMELDSSLIPGTPLADALNLEDYVFEIDLTPNRPDCLSMIGVAREVAAFSDESARVDMPGIDFSPRGKDVPHVSEFATVEIVDSDLCPRYAAGMLVDVKIGPSPQWLQDRLVSVGLTPVNNIVDVTNFVMMETGQPLHAFDYEHLSGGKIEVRRAGTPFSFKTLDGKAHELQPDMLMICDGDGPVAIAGVMGGENSEIMDNTTRVLVESACFNPVSVRKTAKISGINTDASHRFERGVDPLVTEYALRRALRLMAEVSGGTILDGIIDENPLPYAAVEILLDSSLLNGRLGTDFSPEEISVFLESVMFKVTPGSDGRLNVFVPSFRVDVTRPEDLSEEVARLWGYNRINTTYPDGLTRRELPPKTISVRERVRDCMNGFGFTEAVNYSFTSPDMCDRLVLSPEDGRRAVEAILNPISEELAVLRTSLLPGLLENMRRNNAMQMDTVRLFEVGKVFFATEKGQQPLEIEMLSGLWTGSRAPASWHGKKEACDFYDLKGVVEGLLSALGIPGVGFVSLSGKECPYLKQGYGALITHGASVLGALGQVDGVVLKKFGLKQDAFVFDMDMTYLLELVPESLVCKPLPKFPSISRDLTLIVDTDVSAGSVAADIAAFKTEESLVEDVFLFDVYEGAPLDKGKKSLSFRIVYRSWEKTLREKMIKGLHSRISSQLVDRYKAALPS